MLNFATESDASYGLVDKFISTFSTADDEKHNIACIKLLMVKSQTGPPYVFAGITDESLSV